LEQVERQEYRAQQEPQVQREELEALLLLALMLLHLVAVVELEAQFLPL